MFYSATTRGFYTPEIHITIPPDAVEITAGQYAALMQGQSEGQVIGEDEKGFPVLLVPAPLTLAEEVAVLKRALAAYRYEKEVGGLILPNGMKVATDDRSKGLITGARLDTIADPTILTDWKAETGWIQIDADTVAIIATAVAVHVRGCFSAERVHSDALDVLADDPATTTADIEAYDITTGWPV